jgi:hypothetical protein
VHGADTAIAAAESFIHDPATIDAVAEERLRKIREAQAAAENARAEAQRKAEEAKQRAEEAKRQADAARLAAASAAAATAAATPALPAPTPQAPQADQAEKDAQAAAERRIDAAAQSATDTRQKIAAASGSLTALLARPGLAPQARDSAVGIQRQLTHEDEAMHAIETRGAASHGLPSAVEARRAAELEGASKAVAQQASLSIAAAVALAGAPAAEAAAAPAPAAKTPAAGPSVPTCSVNFSGPPGVAGLTLSVDGGKFVPLPADVHVDSGRHSLVVRAGSATAKSTELLVCNRVSKLVVEVPK